MNILNKTINTKNFTIHFFNEKDGVTQGAFEHGRYGEDVGGGLWVKQSELIDYDGVHNLPEEVVEALVCKLNVSCSRL